MYRAQPHSAEFQGRSRQRAGISHILRRNLKFFIRRVPPLLEQHPNQPDRYIDLTPFYLSQLLGLGDTGSQTSRRRRRHPEACRLHPSIHPSRRVVSSDPLTRRDPTPPLMIWEGGSSTLNFVADDRRPVYGHFNDFLSICLAFHPLSFTRVFAMATTKIAHGDNITAIADASVLTDLSNGRQTEAKTSLCSLLRR